MSSLTAFLEELNDSILQPGTVETDPASIAYSMAIEFGARLTSAEVFDNFIPGPVAGEGKSRRRFRIDGYQIDENDGSVHLAITDFDSTGEVCTITKGDVDSIFRQAEHYVEICQEGSIWDRKSSVNEQVELSSYLEKSSETIMRFRFHLFTNREISKQLRELDAGEIGGIVSDYQIWDLGRMNSLALSAIGSEEFEVYFTDFAEKGLPCLKANETDDYEGYLAVIDGGTLAGIYDRFGSRVLEGNVRAYLSARGAVNKGIQQTIFNDPEKFFAYNNGVSCIATGVTVEQSGDAFYLKSAKYFQIVNGGQTTASIYIASKSARSGFSPVSDVSVQMKLAVIKEDSVQPEEELQKAEALEELIYHIARYSNTQNAVKKSDFFSNHEFHRIFESHAQAIQAPPIAGETTTPTHWFYERARGAYDARQMVLKSSEQVRFKREFPRNQRIEKTDLAKYIHAWEQRPHDICDSGQRNFAKFAKTILDNWGESGVRYRSTDFFKESIAKAILYKRLEKLVDKADWYPKGSGYRQGIVSYSISLLSYVIQVQVSGAGLNFKKIWMDQKLSPVLEDQLLTIAERTCEVISAPAFEGSMVSVQGLQWFKKEGCWHKLRETHDLTLNESFKNELLSRDDVQEGQRQSRAEGRQNLEVDQITIIMDLGNSGWAGLKEWSDENNPQYGMKSDLISKMTNPRFYPSPAQTKILYEILEECRGQGFQL